MTTWSDLYACPPECGTRLSIWNTANQDWDTYTYLNGAWSSSTPFWGVGLAVMVCVQPNTNCCTNNLVMNGSFESTSPAVSPNSYDNTLDATTGVPGWSTATGDFLEVWGNLCDGIPAFRGVNHLELNAQSADQTVTQTLTGLRTNCPADFCFAYTGRFGMVGGSPNNDFTVTLSGGASMSVTLNAAEFVTGGWLRFCTNFIPTSSTLTIAFRGHPHYSDGTQNTEGGAHVDNVCLTQPPLPSLTCPADLVLYSPGGGIMVNYPTPVVSDGGLSGCTPPSGSVFPPGLTTVTCTATNECGSTNCSFNVTVLEVHCCEGTNRVVNGGFDEPLVPAGQNGFVTETLTGWDTTEVILPQIEFWNGNFNGMAPQGGPQHLEITAREPNATVSQVISGLSTNCPATLCFYYAGRPFYDNHFTVEIEGSGLLAEVLNGQSYLNAGSWLLYSRTFTPQSSTVTIKFTVSGRPPGALPGGAHIDSVCLTQPPPPSLLCPADITVTVAGAGTNLVLNGSFEQPPVPNHNFTWTPAVPNWTTTDSQNEFELWAGSFGGLTAQAGNQHLEINAHDGDETVSQTIGNLNPTCPTTLCFA